MKKTNLKNLSSALLIIVFLFSFNFLITTLAEASTVSNLGKVAGNVNLNKISDPYVFIGNVINVVLGALGVLFILVLIYAGVLWGFIARGDSSQIKKAKEMIINGLIGLTIVFASYMLTNFVISSLDKAATQSG